MSEQVINITVNHTVRQVSIDVSPAPLQVIEVVAMRGEEPLFLGWKSLIFLTGAKKTGVDAGTTQSISFTDDYVYFCVQGGDAGTAIWKKALLYQT